MIGTADLEAAIGEVKPSLGAWFDDGPQRGAVRQRGRHATTTWPPTCASAALI